MSKGKTLNEILEAALRRLSSAVCELGKIKDGITLFETSPRQDQDALNAWMELDAAQKQTLAALHAAQISRDPDIETEAGRLSDHLR